MDFNEVSYPIENYAHHKKISNDNKTNKLLKNANVNVFIMFNKVFRFPFRCSIEASKPQNQGWIRL